MAIYVWLQCCKCNKSIKLHLFSFSRNKYGVFVPLCEHFNVKYSFTAKYKFFSLGWSIVLEVKVQCRRCSKNHYNFGQMTFNSEFYNIDMRHHCCYNVFILSVDGEKFLNDGKGYLLQRKLREQEEKFIIEHDKKNKEKTAISKKIKFDLDYIDKSYDEMISKEEYKIATDLNFDIEEEIEKNMNYEICQVNLV